MRGSSYIHIIGHVGNADFVVRKAGDSDVMDVNVAVNQKKDDPPTWFRCTFWKGAAETAKRYLKKGDAIAIDGQFTLEEWKDKDGNKRTTCRVDVKNFNLLSPKREETQQAASSEEGV